MARVHGGSFLVNEEGQPIENADVSVYLAGTTTAATVYLDEFSSSSVSTSPQLSSNENGYFEFGLPDPNSASGYSTTQKFKVYGNKAGIETGYIDYIDIYPVFTPVDEVDTDEVKDKAISNLLAFNGESHRLDTTHKVHGIAEVNENSGLNETKNKLVSNSLAYDGENHKTLTFSLSGSGGTGTTYIIGPSGASDDFPHGIRPLDLSQNINSTSSDYGIRNRLISYYYGKKGNDYVDSHDYSEVDETDTDTTKDKVVSNYLMNYLLYQVRHTETVLSHNWAASGANGTIDVTHDLEEEYPVVQMGNTDSNQQESPATVESIDDSTIRVTHGTNIDAKIIILK